jgi:hypothetical protein
MSNQEMQFADPDWKPSQQLDRKTGPQEREAYNPEPINADSREQSQWRTAPPSPPQQGVYSGLPPYAGSAPRQAPGGGYGQQQYGRRSRGRRPWFWIILAIIFLSLASGGFRSMNGFGNGHVVERQQYTVNGQPTIVVNDTSGTIRVDVGGSGTGVTIQATKRGDFFGNPNDIKVDYSQSGNTINAGVPEGVPGSVDFEITVPQGSNLQLNTNSGDINVDGVSGQMTLTTNSGDIQMTSDSMTGTSKIVTNSGDIRFDGTIDTSGTYQFRSDSGSIDVSVPGSSVFHLDASTTSGSITAGDFPGVQKSNTGQSASVDVGGNPQSQRATVIIHTESSEITLHQQ